MKKILSLLASLAISGSSTLGIVSCKIDNLADGERHDVGNWKHIFPIDQPFKQVNNKYYVVIWRTPNDHDWKINLFQFINENTTLIAWGTGYNITYSKKQGYNSGLSLNRNNASNPPYGVLEKRWEDDTKDNEFFKSLYKWDDNTIPTTPNIDQDGNII